MKVENSLLVPFQKDDSEKTIRLESIKKARVREPPLHFYLTVRLRYLSTFNMLSESIALVIFFSTVSCYGWNVTTNPSETSTADVCGSQEIRCVCGIGETRRIITVELKMYAVNVTGSRTECVGVADPYQTCANYSCFLSSHQTSGTNRSTTGADSPSSKFKRHILDSFYPQRIVIPRGNGTRHRMPRQSEPCYIPELQNAEIKCWKWPNWMNCDITCIYGHALQGKKDTATTVNINCRNTENVWKPHGFRDCQPYVNCKTELVKPGSLKCKEPINGPAYCEISCLDYDQYDATSLQKYECVDDSFARTLPHCAKLKDHVELIRKPQK